MAWRIEDSVIRGEIDNRVRGHVTGRIWFAGREEPLELRLTGNPWRDLAGRRMEFTNPEPTPGDLDGLAPLQQGTIGDFTASRKVKVPEIPMDQIGEYYKARKPFPWHWGNSVYLEWYSERNGRVVIESAGYDLKIIGEPAWEMTLEEEEAQRTGNGAAITNFVEQLGESTSSESEYSVEDFTESSDRENDDETEASDSKPQTEAEAERVQAESEKLIDRIQARMNREGDKADYGKIMDEEISRLKKERGEPEPTTEQLAQHAEWLEAMNRAGNEALGFAETEDESKDDHPLVAKARELADQIADDTEERNWLTEADGEEHPVAELVNCTFKASVKLAGALNGNTWPPRLEFCAGVIVRLVKARGYLDDALLAMESCQEQKLVETSWLAVVMVEVIDLARDADVLIAELRERLKENSG
ncbi:MAG TPA: hypothetical protein VGM64_21010 [Lacunisphaera sp.]